MPRVVWVGVEEGREQLVALASAADSKLVKLGFAKEEREFSSHITIGRIKTSKFRGELARGIEEIDASSLGTQTVSSVAVMQSDLQPTGPVYTALRTVALS